MRSWVIPAAAGRDRARAGFVLATLGLQAVKLVVAVVAAGLLTTAEFADWGRLLLLVQYSTYAQLGATMAVNRDVPVLLGAGRTPEAQRLLTAALAAAFATTTLASTVVVWQIDLRDGFEALAFAALPVLTALALFNQTVLRAVRQFGAASSLLVAEAVGWATLVLAVLAWTRSLGYVLAIDGVLVAILISGFVRTRPWLTRFGARDVVLALGSGIPLAASAVVATLRQTADLFVAGLRYETVVFAALTLAATFLRVLYFVPTMTTMLWYPDLGRAYGRDGPAGLGVRTRQILRRFLPAMAIGLPLLLVAVVVALETGLSHYDEFRLLLIAKVAGEGVALGASVLVLYLATRRRLRLVVAANAVGLLPYAVVAALPSAPDQDVLVLAVLLSPALYTAVVVAAYRSISARPPELDSGG